MDDLNKLILIIEDTISETESDACGSCSEEVMDELFRVADVLKHRLKIFNIERKRHSRNI